MSGQNRAPACEECACTRHPCTWTQGSGRDVAPARQQGVWRSEHSSIPRVLSPPSNPDVTCVLRNEESGWELQGKDWRLLGLERGQSVDKWRWWAGLWGWVILPREGVQGVGGWLEPSNSRGE